MCAMIRALWRWLVRQNAQPLSLRRSNDQGRCPRDMRFRSMEQQPSTQSLAFKEVEASGSYGLSAPHQSTPVTGQRAKTLAFNDQRCLTLPSSGRSKGRFAPFGPPLMSNVRALLWKQLRRLSHAAQVDRAARQIGAHGSGPLSSRAKCFLEGRMRGSPSTARACLCRARSGPNKLPHFVSGCRPGVRVSKEPSPASGSSGTASFAVRALRGTLRSNPSVERTF